RTGACSTSFGGSALSPSSPESRRGWVAENSSTGTGSRRGGVTTGLATGTPWAGASDSAARGAAGAGVTLPAAWVVGALLLGTPPELVAEPAPVRPVRRGDRGYR